MKLKQGLKAGGHLDNLLNPKEEKPEKKQLSFYLEKGLYEDFGVICRENLGQSASAVIEAFMRDIVDDYGPPPAKGRKRPRTKA